MPAKTFAFSFVLGASLSKAFSTNIGSATARVKGLGQQIGQLNADSTYKLVKRFHELKDGLRTSRGELKKAQAELAALEAQAKKTGGSNKMLAKRIEQADKRVASLAQRVARSTTNFINHRAKMQSTGQSLGKLARHYRGVETQIKKTSRAQEHYSKLLKKQKELASRRGEYRGQMMDMAAMGYAVAAPVVQAAQAQRSATRLSTVINATDKGAAMSAGRASAKDLARTGLVDYGQAFDIQYALNSAGFSAEAARAADDVVAKVATVTAGMPERVGEVIATTYNNLGDAMTGTTQEKMNRIGDLLTKVQFKFQIRNFGQLGESLTEGAAGLANYNVNLAQGVTLLGQLNSAGLQGSRAGTALNATLRQMGKAAEELGFSLVRDSQGQLDLIATLKQLDASLASLDQDERAQTLQKIFGDEGAKGVVPLLKQLDKLRDAQRDVVEGSKGLVDREVVKFTEDSVGQFKRLANNVVLAGDGFGKVLLPGVNAVMGGLASTLGFVGDMAEKFPVLTTVIGGTVTAFMAMRIATIAYGYASSFVGGGIATLSTAVAWLKSTQLGATIATKAITVAQWLWNVALNANPIGLVVAGVAALATGAYLVIKHWEPIKAFFLDLWDSILSGVTGTWNAIKSVPLIGDAINWFSGGEAIPDTVAKGIDSKATAPGAALERSFQKADELVPHSDAKRGPFARLTEAGQAILITMGQGISSGGSGLMGRMAAAFDNTFPNIASTQTASARGERQLVITFEQTIHAAGGDPAQVRAAAKAGAEAALPQLEQALRRYADNERRLRLA